MHHGVLYGRLEQSLKCVHLRTPPAPPPWSPRRPAYSKKSLSCDLPFLLFYEYLAVHLTLRFAVKLENVGRKFSARLVQTRKRWTMPPDHQLGILHSAGHDDDDDDSSNSRARGAGASP